MASLWFIGSTESPASIRDAAGPSYPVLPMVGSFGTPGDGDAFPFEFTVEEICEVWWRIKAFEVAVDCSFGAIAVNPSPIFASCVVSPSVLPDEFQRFNPQYYTWEGSVDATTGSQIRVVSATVEVMSPFDLSNDPATPYHTTGASFWPRLRIIVDFSWDDGSEVVGTITAYGAALTPLGFSFMGREMSWSSDTSIAPTSVAITVTAKEWFAHDAGDGKGPTFDTTTGTVLPGMSPQMPVPAVVPSPF